MKSEPSRARALRRQLTATFYRKNKATFFVTAGAMLLLGGALLAVAWILQQIIDIASGDSVAPLVRMCWLCLGVLVSVTTIYVVQCYTYPAFLRRAMKQYKEYAFTELTKKSISTFSDENTSRYISALTNDAVCIETNYLAKIFTLLTKSVSFVGGLVMMLLYSPLLTGFALLLSLVPLAVSVLCGNRLARMETDITENHQRQHQYGGGRAERRQGRDTQTCTDMARRLAPRRRVRQTLRLLQRLCGIPAADIIGRRAVAAIRVCHGGSSFLSKFFRNAELRAPGAGIFLQLRRAGDDRLALRELSAMGHFAPVTTPTILAPANMTSDLTIMLPAAMPGTSRISVSPVTGLS